MGINLLDMPDKWLKRRTHNIFDDFYHYVTADDFTTVATDSGTVSVGDTAGGVVALVASDGTVADNDETYIRSTKEVFLFAANKPLACEARLQFAEANTDDANVFFGFIDAIAANTIVDDGAGLKTTASGACIFKVDGGTVWKFMTSLSTTQTISTSTTTAGGASYQTLKIEVNPISSTQAEAIPYVNGVQLVDSNNKPIKHLFTYTSATEMCVGGGVKNGGANLETLNFDYIAAAQLR
jgi:hypothetical protein